MPLWAKVDVDMPTDEKLFGQPLATRHLWTCLICLAKRQDHAGAINGYDCALLASRFNIPRKCVALALTHYQAVRMVELDPDGTIRLINFLERQGPEDTSAERASRYYEAHRETIREKRKASRKRSNGVLTRSLTPFSRETVSLEGEVEEEREIEEREATDLPAPPAPAPTAEVWESYSDAFEQRHGVRPPDSAKGRSQLKQFLTRVPAKDAPHIAAFFLTHNDALYIRAKHPTDLLLRDAAKLYTEWQTGQQVTGAEARHQERTQENVGGWMALDTKGKKHGVAGS